MFLAEPPRTSGDVLFRLFDFPVRIHPFFWVVAVLLGFNSDGTPPLDLLVWVAVMLVSIVVHELGHAFLQRRYGGKPRIVLYSFGGLAITDYVDYTPRRQILISLAGPAAGFILALAIVILLRLTGHGAGLQFGREFDFQRAGVSSVYPLSLFIATVYWEPLGSKFADLLVGNLLQVNILWGLLNLMPIYPLDGGHISRELCTLKNPSRGIVLSLQISIAAAAVIALLTVTRQQLFLAIMFGFLAYSNFQTLQRYQGSRW